MGSSGQLYSLSWGEFGTSLASAVQLLRGHGDLVDVTLAAGGRSFPAHKIVLSAASPFLLDLLKSTPCQHPVVMLAGISSDDLESLLEFVYRGEVSVEPSQLPSLLQAAHCLSIHGLTPPTILTENGEEVPVSAIPTNTEPVTREIMNSCIPIHRRKKRRKSSSSCSKWPKMDNTTDSEDRHDGHGEDDRTTDYDQKNDDGGHDDDGHYKGKSSSDLPTTCPLCGVTLRQSRNLRRHLELLHFGSGNNGKASVRVRRRKHDFHPPTMVPRADSLRISESSDFSTTSLSFTSTNSGLSNPSGNLSSSGSNTLLSSEQNSFSNAGIQPGSCSTGNMPGPLTNGIYPSESSANILSCLLPNISSLSLPHDVFRHGEMLKASIAYHDSSRQHVRHMQRTDVT
ncbi:transcription factor GAGA-like isoform X6 [Chelonus insularis]|uniref:transcription factor GAGA-like isoform X6 n=1 Tax=Chelonus insularis TaxID=460826 RepID=UPI00158BA329|nr:transcription factor GAGA-like isoform X6 [Chelonus insularis]